MGLQTSNWIFNILRVIFAGLDWVIYGLLRFIVTGIFDLSEVTTAPGFLSDVYTRVYVLLGVFMAFKLSFSFIQYMINPDLMADKNEKGVNKLIINTIVMIIALVALPGILFGNDENGGLLRRAQNAFLPMLPRVLLGVSEDSGVSIGNGSNTDNVAEISDNIAITALQSFFAPREEIDSYCGSGTYQNTPQIKSLDDFFSVVNLDCKNTENKEGGAPKYYRYSYLFGVSTAVGIVLVFMFVGIAVEVAKRIFKMLILELIAPIPIMSLIDPKSSKDGAFSKWVKNLISTFISIFINLGLLYLVLILMNKLTNDDLFSTSVTFKNNPVRWSVLYIFILMGLINFVREAPKFIKDSIGIKDDGGNSAIGRFTGMAAGALAGGATGFVSGAISGRGLRGALTGAAVGTSSGISAAGTGKPSGAWRNAGDTAGQMRTGDKNYKSGIGNAISRGLSARQGRGAARRLGVTENSLTDAKDAMTFDEEALSDAQRRYSEAVQSGVGVDAARDNLVDAEKRATSSKKTYEKMSKLAESFGVAQRTPQQEMRQNRNPLYRASRAVRTATTRAIGNISEGILDSVEGGTNGFSKAVRSVDAAVHQHRANQITRKGAIDSAVVTRDSAGKVVSHTNAKDDHLTKRDALDSAGTIQNGNHWESK